MPREVDRLLTSGVIQGSVLCRLLFEIYIYGIADELDCANACLLNKGRKEMFYLTTHSTHFIYRLYGV